MIYNGIGGSAGIAAGSVYIYKSGQVEVNDRRICPEAVKDELSLLEQGIIQSRTQLEKLKEKVASELGENKAMIFDAHIMMLEDPEFLNTVREAIRTEKENSAHAVAKAADFFVSLMEQIEDAYMRERAADIRDVSERLIRNLSGAPVDGLRQISSPVIIVANDLSPSDTALMNKELVLGLVTDMGGGTSHTAIMAKSLGIPAVLGLGDFSLRMVGGEHIIIDGSRGIVIVDPEPGQEVEYRKKILEYKLKRERYLETAANSAVTPDGRTIEISGNIGTPEDIAGVLANGGDGIGLFRTEFLYMNRNSMPGEQEQFEEYRKAAAGMKGKPVIIRTLDIGGDKKLSYLKLPEEMNPFLGWRAIRICLEMKDMFRTQLRAILRASAYGNILIMFPMISGIEEVREARVILTETASELKREGIQYNEAIKVGIMVEIPSAAMTADKIAKEVDFFSIGTNDLCQYSLAVDRMNPKVSKLYQPLHPGVLRLIKNVIDASHSQGKFTGMCGEMAGSVEAAVILLGLGLDEYSMSAANIPLIKNVIRRINYEKAREIANQALEMETPAQVLEYSRGILAQLGIEYM